MGAQEEKRRQEAREDRKTALNVLNHGSNALFKAAVALAFVLLMFYGIRTAYRFGYSVFTTGAAEEAPGRDMAFVLEEGKSMAELSAELEKQGLIKSARIFRVQARIYGYELRPGSYTLNTSMTPEEIIRKLAGGTS